MNAKEKLTLCRESCIAVKRQREDLDKLLSMKAETP